MSGARARRRDGTIACVFPPCRARITLVTHRTDPYDKTKTVLVIPIHEVEGPASWFGRCPASQFAMPVLSARAKQVLVEAQAEYVRRLAEQINKEAERRRQNVLRLAVEMIDEVADDIPLPNERRPEVPPEYNWPPRPADDENR